ncbi:hypothetical protein [Tunicatimonas pelagia]|uniref:hypothetical protein n=1 Tax=Tunicatimonas pelagia TaxID=931531 RepID=UPI002665EF6B|nr:hypothetical protein [Tunicatimonas pelagia]WKN44586.1 hypothetical protein P0M28_06370 [Tunicatimonas pelagia]
MKFKTIVLLLLFLGMSTALSVSTLHQVQAQHIQADDILLSESKFYYRIPPTSVNHFNIGDIVAAPYQPKLSITSAEVTEGSLPKGMALFPNGFIVVEQSDAIEVGNHSLTITTTDVQENKTTTSLSIEVINSNNHTDREAVYQMESHSIISKLEEGDILAQPIDQDGSIKAAKWVMGGIPPGTRLTANGQIVVTDPKLLVPRIYNAGIVTVDQLGGVTFFMVTVPIEAGDDIR